jgi:beta-N-acetylhexosaminidase
LGLQQEGIIATAKHYPGKTLVVRDPHKFIVSADISNEDLYPYQYLSGQGDVKAIMISHIIPSGAVAAQSPAVASPELITHLQQNFSGLIISDEINMLGLKNFYPTLDGLYIAVFAAGNDLILNFLIEL